MLTWDRHDETAIEPERLVVAIHGSNTLISLLENSVLCNKYWKHWTVGACAFRSLDRVKSKGYFTCYVCVYLVSNSCWTCVKNMAVHRLTDEILLMPRGVHHCSIVFNVLMFLIVSLLAFQRKKKTATYSASQRSSMVSTFYSCANVKANASLACTECAWQYGSHVIAKD